MIKVMVGIPVHKGEVCAATLTSVMQGTQGGMGIIYKVSGMSLLANNFNRIFCDAYTMGMDFLIILHSDLGISVEGFPFFGSWLDILIRRTIELKAAVLSVVVPIKTFDGLTSLAIQIDRGNPYTFRRISIRELDQLPERFISRIDICTILGLDPAIVGPMLVNTGCMVMDLKNHGWCHDKWPGFHIDDVVKWNRRGVPDYRVRPEDWNLSRWLFDHQYPYYAIKDVVAEHHGSHAYVNRGLWGLPSDPHPFQSTEDEYERS